MPGLFDWSFSSCLVSAETGRCGRRTDLEEAHAMLTTPLTSLLGIQHPVLSAGMARVAQADLVVAVSNAGGMGCLGGISYMPDALRAEIRDIRARTDKPFAVDLVVPDVLRGADGSDQWAGIRSVWSRLSDHERERLKGIEPMMTPGAVEAQIEVIKEEKPPVLCLTFDAPADLVAECHALGIKVGALAGSIGRSVAADEAGVDFIVAQGTEGGGHTGYVGTLALIPAVVDAVSVPVAAAGGIVDGRGLAAALCLGATGAWCGTRFIASVEAYGHQAYKDRVVAATTKETTTSKAYTGKNLRTLRNAWTERWEGRESELQGFPAQYAVAGMRVETGYQDGELKEGLTPAGQGVGLVHAILPAKEIVNELVRDAEEVVSSVAQFASPLGATV
jgi:enoyl-[acyl-carrier protein] reductase II